MAGFLPRVLAHRPRCYAFVSSRSDWRHARMSIPYVVDSRRLTGPSLLLDSPGAILELRLPRAKKALYLRDWEREVRKLLRRLRFNREQVVVRDQGRSQMVAISAPLDALLTATFINEAAFERVLALHTGRACDDVGTMTDVLLTRMALRSDPRLVALVRAAELHGVPWMLGEGDLSLGYGAVCSSYPDDDLPLPDEVDWDGFSARPLIALITGTNGKTTTTRLLARMLSEGGHTTGFCSTDTVQIGTEITHRDDYSGPTGARLVLRDQRIDAAVLEVARGGMLRRGLSVREADLAVVLNVADDHLGDAGIYRLDQLAEAKMLIRKGLKRRAPLLLNADNPHLLRFAKQLDQRLQWFALKRPAAALRARGDAMVYIEDGQLVHERDGRIEPLCAQAQITIGFAGAARHNIANAAAASLAALQLGVSAQAVGQALRGFGSSLSDNPGRANVFSIRGAQVIADYGHNPDGYDAMLRLVQQMPHKRLTVVIGQAGDRSDSDIRALAERAAAAKPQQVYVKALHGMARGRAPGEVSQLLHQRLLDCGVPATAIRHFERDAQAVEAVLQGLRPDDLALIFLHEDQSSLLQRLGEAATA